ncbi:MAG: hypothetical protein ACI8XX_002141, partial [Polaribacter sp.]
RFFKTTQRPRGRSSPPQVTPVFQMSTLISNAFLQ